MVVNYLELETSKSLKRMEKMKDNFLQFRVPDTHSIQRLNRNIIALKSPCDYIALYKGKMHMIECKSSQNKTSYSWRYIRPHQLTYLQATEDAGGRGWFLLNRRHNRHITCVALTPQTVQKLMDVEKSTKWVELFKLGIPIDRIQGGMWDLNPLFRTR